MSTELIPQKTTIAMGQYGLMPTTLDETWRLCQYIVDSGLAPKQFATASQVLIAIQSGAELGMPPMQSLGAFAVINGRPSLYGDALMGLVLASGKCEAIKEWIEGDGENMVASCQTLRVGMDAVTSKFSIQDAKLAGLWKKPGPWQQYPKRMLQMRARAFNFRDNFADVLKGMAVAEEMQDIPQPTGGKALTLSSLADEPIMVEAVACEAAAAGTVKSGVGFVPPEKAAPPPESDVAETLDPVLLLGVLAGCNTPSDVKVYSDYWAGNDEAQRLCGVRTVELMVRGDELKLKG